MKRINGLKIIALAITWVACQGVFADEEVPVTNRDPFETFNRPMFAFNDWLDRWILKPVATLYIKIMPKPLSKGISNAYNNIDTIPTILNDLLQGNFYQAVSDTWRLGINTTIGVVGLFDVATSMGLEPNNKEDFGLTLAQWGWVNSNYLVLPFIGPGTVRDQLGWPINYQFLTIYPYIRSDSVRYGLYGGGIVVRRAEVLHYESVMEQAALDKYTFVRDAYLQRRAYVIERNKQLGNPYLEKNNQLVEAE
jgi:phospholipid-binding lipoprotein MlaA